MGRTTEDQVRGILLKDYDSQNNPSLDPFIEAASALTDGVVAAAARKGVVLGDASLELIERWLAAHGYCMNDPQYSEKQTGRARGVYLGDKAVKGLDGSRYGQHAKLLDPTGYLKALDKGGGVGLYWLGLYPSEQTPACDKE